MNNISERLGLVVHWLGWLCTIFIVVIIFHTNSYHLFDDEYPDRTSNASEECKELLREYREHLANERWDVGGIDEDEYKDDDYSSKYSINL